MNEFLREHNIETYKNIEKMYAKGANRVGVVQATGTGKSYLAIQLLYDDVVTKEGKRALVLEPLYGIMSQFEANLQKCCAKEGVKPKNVDFVHYSGLLNVSEEEFKSLNLDYIILDEFHGLGAEGRGSAVDRLLKANPNAKVLGLSATPIRYLDKKRDMGAELFGTNIVWGINLAEAIQQHVLPTPEYVMCTYSYSDVIKDLEDQIEKVKDKRKKAEFKKQLAMAKAQAEKAEGLSDLFARKIKNKNGKFIAFCADINRLNSLKEEISGGLFSKVNPDVKLYSITSKQDKATNEKMLKNFEKDDSDRLKIMLAVDMFNEGIHVKGVDGCFMFRPTISPRIYLQQLGRVLSVREDKDFSPVVFDVVNNINGLDMIEQAFENDSRKPGAGEGGNFDFIPFKIEGNDLKLNEFLRKIKETVEYEIVSPDKWLDAARAWAAEHDGTLDVPQSYIDEETGLHLGTWLHGIRREANGKTKQD